GWARRLAWVALAMIPSSLMLGVTAAASTDLPPVPMLWVAPLAIYLLTFVIAFRQPPHRLRWAAWALPAAVVAEAALASGAAGTAPPLVELIALHLGAFAAVAMGCHGGLAAPRPPVGRMTEFYLCLAAGGVLGGLLNAVVAPAVFNSVVELPLALAAAALVIPVTRAALREQRSRWLLPAGGVAAAAVLLAAFTA